MTETVKLPEAEPVLPALSAATATSASAGWRLHRRTSASASWAVAVTSRFSAAPGQLDRAQCECQRFRGRATVRGDARRDRKARDSRVGVEGRLGNVPAVGEAVRGLVPTAVVAVR